MLYFLIFGVFRFLDTNKVKFMKSEYVIMVLLCFGNDLVIITLR